MAHHETQQKHIGEAQRKRAHQAKLVRRGRLGGRSIVGSAGGRQILPLRQVGSAWCPKIYAKIIEALSRGNNVESGNWLFILEKPGQASNVFSVTITENPHATKGRRTIGKFGIDLGKKTITRK